MNRLLDDLNPQQREAVTQTDGPLLIIAGAGSGKTRVLTRRLAYILTERKAEPREMLAVTFTNKAAGEMKERVYHLLGTTIGDLQVSTFHSFCARLLRREAAALGYTSNFTIFDDDDSQRLMKNCIKELNISDSQFPAKGQLRKVSQAKDKLVSPEQFTAQSSGYFDSRTAQLYTLYQRRLLECNAMDFDDLLYNTVKLLTMDPLIGERYRKRFKYLLVDEYQDTNHSQYLLLKALLDDHHNICVVGDEDQSIYGWRGADIRNILDFEKDFPNAKIIKLEQNYRSTKVILQAASTVIANNAMRKGKTLWTDIDGGDPIELIMTDNADEEAARVVDRIAMRGEGEGLSQQAILYRTNAQSRAFEEALRRRRIAYQIVGGILFYQRKEIKDLMAYLKLLINPNDDIAFARVINYPKRGLGEKTIDDIFEIAKRERVSAYSVALRSGSYPELSGKAKRIEPFVALLEDYRQRADTQVADLLIANLIADVKLLPALLEEDPIVGQTKVENVEAFVEGAADFARAHHEAHLSEYLAEISLFTDAERAQETEDKVTLMTIHAAKGLEYRTVYLVGLEEGLFPLQRTVTEKQELEEERRLFYVGATRAQAKLVLSTRASRHQFGQVESIPSRFIREIPKELLQVRDYRTGRNYDYSGAEQAPQPIRNGGYRPEPKPARMGVYYDVEEETGFAIGRLVAHPTFGRGKILSIEGYGDNLRLEIMFTGLGVKKIMAKYAKLKLVG